MCLVITADSLHNAPRIKPTWANVLPVW